MLKIGIRSSSLSGAFSIDGLRRLRDAGFELIELNFNHKRAGLDPFDVSQAAAFRDTAGELGVTLLAHGPDTLSLTDGDLDEQVREYVRAIEGMAEFGCRAVVMHPDAKVANAARPAGHYESALVRVLRELAAGCERLAVDLYVETMTPIYLTRDLDLLMRAVEAAGGERVRICLDTNHLNLTEDPAGGIRRAAARLGELHLNDNHGVQEEHLLPYAGIIDWDSVTAAVAEADFRGPIVLEPSWKEGQSPETMIPRAREVADRLLRDIARARDGGR